MIITFCHHSNTIYSFLILRGFYFLSTRFAGGEDRNGSFSVVEKYDPKEDEWEVVPDMQQKRAGAGVVGCNGRLYVAGE